MYAKLTSFRMAVLAFVTATGTACGGGAGEAPQTAALPTPPPNVAIDRIELYDTAAVTAPRAITLIQRAMSVAQARSALQQIVLGPLEVYAAPARGAPADKAVRSGQRAPVQIGVARALDATADAAALARQLRWIDGPSGSRIAAVSFRSQGAQGVRLGVRVEQMPAAAVLRFYAQDGGLAGDVTTQMTAAEVSATAAQNLRAGANDDDAYTVWSPDFGGAETTLEIELPASASPTDLQLSVPRLSHFLVAPSAAADARVGNVGAADRCEVDVVCRSGNDAQSRSVALMTFVKSGASFLCTGTLLNDARSSGVPYFLTARHCVTTQAEASSLVADWFFRADTCGGNTVSSAARRTTGGATLLYASAATDVAMLRLHSAPPAGVVYAGSYFGVAPTVGSPISTIHHPAGDLQKLSEGRIVLYSQCVDFSCLASSEPQAGYFGVQWSEGVTEDGSSGSPLFLPLEDKHYLVGHLGGGSSSCLRRDGLDQYGRFDRAYREAIHQWLNPF